MLRLLFSLPRRRVIRLAVGACLLPLSVCLAASEARARTFDWVGGNVDNDVQGLDDWWSNGVRFVRNNYGNTAPNSVGVPIPGPSDTVRFTTDATIGGSDPFGGIENRANVSVNGPVRISDGGVIDNRGEMYLYGGNRGSIRTIGEVTLRGPGIAYGFGGSSDPTIQGGGRLLIAPEATYAGYGALTSEIRNTGTMRFEGGHTELVKKTLDNRGGVVQIASDGSFSLNSSFSFGPHEWANFVGGTIHGEAGADLTGYGYQGAYHDVRLTGEVDLYGFQHTLFTGTLTNDAELGFVPSGANDRHLLVNGALTITGNGRFTLGEHGNVDNFLGELRLRDSTRVENRGTHTIAGQGRVYATLENHSVIAPGVEGAGWMTITDLVNEPTGEIHMQLGGTWAGVNHDRLLTETAQLGGELRLELIDGFTPSEGDVFELLRAEEGLTGSFDSVVAPSLGDGLSFALRERSTSSRDYLELVVVDDLPGDLNADGHVDAADYTLARDGGPGERAALDTWRAWYGAEIVGPGGGSGGGPGFATAVPEPGCLAGLLVTVAVGTRRRGRRDGDAR